MPDRKEKIGAAFSRNAANYDRYAVLQREIGERLARSLTKNGENILDVGCGTGALLKSLREKYPQARITGIDLAPGMLKEAAAALKGKKIKLLEADGENLPFRENTFDLVVSNASLQWMDAKKAVAEAARVLKFGGTFAFTTFGPATFRELKLAGLSVNRFPGKKELEKLLARHFKAVTLVSEKIVQRYKDIFAFFADLKGLGAQNPEEVRHKGLLTKRKLLALLPEDKDGINIRYEVFFVECFFCAHTPSLQI